MLQPHLLDAGADTTDDNIYYIQPGVVVTHDYGGDNFAATVSVICYYQRCQLLLASLVMLESATTDGAHDGAASHMLKCYHRHLFAYVMVLEDRHGELRPWQRRAGTC